MAKLIGVTTIDTANGEITKVAYEGAEYAKVENGDVGDIAVVVDGWGRQSVGEFYVVTDISSSCGYTYAHVDGEIRGANCRIGRMNYFRKTSVQASPTNTDVSIADVSAKVDAIDARVSALEKADEPTEFKVGDRVEVVDASDSHYEDFDNGNIGTIVATESLFSDEGYPYEFSRNDDHDYFSASALRKVADEPKVEPLKVGDCVKVTESYGDSFVGIGDVCEIIYDDTYEPRFKLKRVIDGMESGYMYEEGLDKATNAEVAEAKALVEQSAKDAKLTQVFTQAGRKPNEYRKGDIGRYIGASSLSGAVAEVENDTVGDKTRIDFRKYNFGVCTEPFANLEPITFVESRLDK